MGNDDNCIKIIDSEGKELFYYELGSKLKSVLQENFIEELEQLDTDKINSEDEYCSRDNELYDRYKLKWKALEKYLLYDYSFIFETSGLIDSEGEVMEDKECEYDFLIKYLNSSFL